MVKHYNTTLAERAGRVFNTKGVDQFSDDVSPNLVPVVPILPVTRIVRSTSSAATGTAVIYTTPVDKDFYLTGFSYQMMCDGSADLTGYNLNVFIDGVQLNVAQVRKITLHAFSDNIQHDFAIPIKIDRGKAISISQTFSVGNSTHAGCIYGYTEEVTRT